MKWWPRRNRQASMHEEGFVLLTTGLCSIAMIGMLGVAVDLGRMYIVKNEMQAYADAASLAAALELDSTSSGIARAQAVVAASLNRWEMSTTPFAGTQLDFATSGDGPWLSNPSPATGYRFARVRATGDVPLYLIPAVVSRNTSTVRANAVAAQLPKTSYAEGVLPFSPFAHDNGSPPHFGYAPGTWYTLRWGSNIKLGKNICPGDDEQAWADIASAGDSSERGYIEETSSAVIRQAIEQDYMTRPLSIGDLLDMSGGIKQTQRNSLITRISQDSDPTSASYSQYDAGGSGNGRRVVVVPINNGYPENRVLGFGAFFLLLPSEYSPAGNAPFCAEYIGPYVQGSSHVGAGSGGSFVVRLVQ